MEQMQCPICEETKSVRGLNGHLRMKHKLSNEEANLITRKTATQGELDDILDRYKDDEEEKEGVEETARKGELDDDLDDHLEEKKEEGEEEKVLDKCQRILSILDEREQIKVRRVKVRRSGLFRTILLGEERERELEALERAEADLEAELVRLGGPEIKDEEEIERALEEEKAEAPAETLTCRSGRPVLEEVMPTQQESEFDEWFRR